ncbi:hypothetical protein ACEWAJ_23830, partial [Vibrio parahaemolyticus]
MGLAWKRVPPTLNGQSKLMYAAMLFGIMLPVYFLIVFVPLAFISDFQKIPFKEAFFSFDTLKWWWQMIKSSLEQRLDLTWTKVP